MTGLPSLLALYSHRHTHRLTGRLLATKWEIMTAPYITRTSDEVCPSYDYDIDIESGGQEDGILELGYEFGYISVKSVASPVPITASVNLSSPLSSPASSSPTSSSASSIASSPASSPASSSASAAAPLTAIGGGSRGPARPKYGAGRRHSSARGVATRRFRPLYAKIFHNETLVTLLYAFVLLSALIATALVYSIACSPASASSSSSASSSFTSSKVHAKSMNRIQARGAAVRRAVDGPASSPLSSAIISSRSASSNDINDDTMTVITQEQLVGRHVYRNLGNPVYVKRGQVIERRKVVGRHTYTLKSVMT